jgi:hypothetical protein
MLKDERLVELEQSLLLRLRVPVLLDALAEPA